MAWWDTPHKHHMLLAQQALESLHPRGPDSQTFVHLPQPSMGLEMYLGHTRLGLTGKHGRQPFVSEDQQVYVLVNGQFYNHALHEHYRQQGFVFHTDTDSELLLALYLDKGIQGLAELDGEFAAIIWDQRVNEVFAIRDRSGNKPLKFVCQGPTLQLASTARALWAMGHRPTWDHTRLHQALAWQYPDPQHTLFDHIHQPAPGEYVRFVWDPATQTWRMHRHRWFTWFAPTSSSSPISLVKNSSSTDEQLIHILRQAVRERVEGGWPVAVHVSGGVDSTSILSLAQECLQDMPHPPQLHAYGVGFDQTPWGHDESQLAEKTCEILNLPFTKVHLSLEDMLEGFEHAVGVAEHPFINGHGVAKALLSQRIHQDGFRVSLSGEGSDEALLGYAFLHPQAQDPSFTDQFITQQGVMLPHRDVLALPSHHPSMVLKTWMSQNGQMPPVWLEAKWQLGARVYPLLKEDDVHQSTQAVFAWAQATSEVWNTPLERVHREAALWAHVALGGYILPALADAPEAHHHVQGRTPFLDASVLAFAHALSPEQTGWPCDPKRALRAYLRTKGLHHIADRPKHPFDAPSMLLSASNRQALRQRWYRSSIWKHTPLDLNRLQAWMNTWDSMSDQELQQQDPVLCTVFSLWSMVRQYGIS